MNIPKIIGVLHVSISVILQESTVALSLTSGNTGNNFLQLVSQHCCVASWNSVLRLYHVRDQLVSQQSTVLQVCGILHVLVNPV